MTPTPDTPTRIQEVPMAHGYTGPYADPSLSERASRDMQFALDKAPEILDQIMASCHEARIQAVIAKMEEKMNRCEKRAGETSVPTFKVYMDGQANAYRECIALLRGES